MKRFDWWNSMHNRLILMKRTRGQGKLHTFWSTILHGSDVNNNWISHCRSLVAVVSKLRVSGEPVSGNARYLWFCRATQVQVSRYTNRARHVASIKVASNWKIFRRVVLYSFPFKPQTRFIGHSVWWTGGLHRSRRILGRTSTTLTPPPGG